MDSLENGIQDTSTSSPEMTKCLKSKLLKFQWLILPEKSDLQLYIRLQNMRSFK